MFGTIRKTVELTKVPFAQAEMSSKIAKFSSLYHEIMGVRISS
jgi:hypothetical protein